VIIEKTFRQKCDLAIRQTLPFLTAFVAALLMATQTHVPRLNPMMPMLTLGVVFFWAVHRPLLFGMGSAFLIGLMQDLITGVPIGLGALILLLTRAGVAPQARLFLGKPLVFHWWGFILLALAAALLSWILAAVILGMIAPIGQVLMSAFLGVVVFPLTYGICTLLEKLLVEEP